MDVKTIDPEATDRLSKVEEYMDDGGNWIKIVVKEGTAGSKYVRDLYGNLPSIQKPMALFFGGSLQYFAKNGMFLTAKGLEYLRKAEKDLKRIREQNRKEQAEIALQERQKAEMEAAQASMLQMQQLQMMLAHQSMWQAPPGAPWLSPWSTPGGSPAGGTTPWASPARTTPAAVGHGQQTTVVARAAHPTQQLHNGAQGNANAVQQSQPHQRAQGVQLQPQQHPMVHGMRPQQGFQQNHVQPTNWAQQQQIGPFAQQQAVPLSQQNGMQHQIPNFLHAQQFVNQTQQLPQGMMMTGPTFPPQNQ